MHWHLLNCVNELDISLCISYADANVKFSSCSHLLTPKTWFAFFNTFCLTCIGVLTWPQISPIQPFMGHFDSPLSVLHRYTLIRRANAFAWESISYKHVFGWYSSTNVSQQCHVTFPWHSIEAILSLVEWQVYFRRNVYNHLHMSEILLSRPCVRRPVVLAMLHVRACACMSCVGAPVSYSLWWDLHLPTSVNDVERREEYPYLCCANSDKPKPNSHEQVPHPVRPTPPSRSSHVSAVRSPSIMHYAGAVRRCVKRC